MKLFSWNVNGLRAVTSKGEWQKFVSTYQADIIALQEIKAKVDQIDAKLLDGYHCFINSAQRPGYAGTAIFSKIQPLKVNFDLPTNIVKQFQLQDERFGQPNNEGRVITAEYPNFYLVNCYTPNAKSELERLDLRQIWDKAFLHYLQTLEKTKAVIVCGDLNVAHQAIDLARPKDNLRSAGFTEEERLGFTNLLKAGFIDTFRHFYPSKEQAYTWWSWRSGARQRNIGWRIDYFLSSAALKPKLLAAAIHPEQLGSDHCPVSLELELK